MRRILRRSIGIFMAIVMAASLLPGLAVTASAAGPSLSGEGTELSPYLITNKDEFIVFRDWVNGGNDCANQYFEMTNTIDLDGSSKNIHTPIGSPDTPFKGHFDGTGHAVINMYTYRKNGSYMGLFGYVGEGGYIKNVRVYGYVGGLMYSGGIAGWSDGVIENCTNHCYVESDNFSYGGTTHYNGYCGGIVGSSGADIIDCGNYGFIEATIGDGLVGQGNDLGCFGGISGESRGGDILNCFNAGTVRNHDGSWEDRCDYPLVGGIAGVKMNGKVKNCYNTARIDGDIDVTWSETFNSTPTDHLEKTGGGGIVSKFDLYSSLENCYNTYNTDEDFRVISYGRYKSAKTIVNCFYSKDGRFTEQYATGLDPEDFAKPELLNALNENNDSAAWAMSGCAGRPLLINNPETMYGSGTKDDPYIIKNAHSFEDFMKLVKDSNGFSGQYARLEADIDLLEISAAKRYYGDSDSGSENKWTPIGTDDVPFNGHFDGSGHTISNLYTSSTNEQGLFGTVGSDAVIENLNVKGNVWCNENINAGIAVKCSGKITNCYTDVFFSSDTSRESGGIVGILKSGGVITNCYSVGKPQMVNGSGGLVAEMEGGSEVSDSYFYNTLIGPGLYFGRIAYIRAASAVINNCYWLEDSTHYRIPGHGVIQGDESGIQSLPKDGFVNLADALNHGGGAWSDSSLGRPILNANSEAMFSGAGTEENPYIISSLDFLRRFCKYIRETGGDGEYFKLTVDIDLSPPYGEGKQSWTPVGTASVKFGGTFDGGGHTISGFYLKSTGAASPYQGMFGCISESGTVKDLTVTGLMDCKGEYIGAIAGECLGTITDCRSGVTIAATGGYVGGIVGKYGGNPLSGCSAFSKDGSPLDGIAVSGDHVGGIVGATGAAITNCRVSVPVSGVNYVGGIIGDMETASITGCGVSADVSGGTNVGGIIGEAMKGTISNSYLSTGVNVSGDANVGGILGNTTEKLFLGDRSVHISNCYTAGGGTISAVKGDNVGGIAGVVAYDSSTIENCTNNNDVKGNNYTGGIVGLTQTDYSLSVIGCHNNGDVTGADYTGGVAGCDTATVISQCSNSGDVSGHDYTGGVSGYHKFIAVPDNVLSESYNIGAVSGNQDVGGVIGLNTGTSAQLYNAGSVNGWNNVGGIVGELRDDNSYTSPTQTWTAVVGHAYNYGAVTSSHPMYGATIGLIRRKSNRPESSSYSDLYYLKDSCARASGSPIIGEFLVRSMDAVVFAGDTVANLLGKGTWKGNSLLGRPTLISNPETALEGDGTPGSPFIIPDLETLEEVRDYVNDGGGSGTYFKLTNDIDMSDKYGDGKESWSPVGTDVSHPFKGILDGGGHTISGLYVNDSENAGLFGYVKGGMVKNLAVSGSVTGDGATGGIVGTLEGGTIENCLNECTVSGGADAATGGIVGAFETNSGTGAESVIKSCLNMGGVSASGTSGAVAGTSATDSSRIENCYYLDGSAQSGVGSGGTGSPEAKTAEELKTGTVAYLLQDGGEVPIWGQTIGGDDHPVLSDMIVKRVMKVTFVTDSDKEYAVNYVNYGGTVTPPPAPENDGYIFNMWAVDADQYKFTADTPVTSDMKVYAVGRAPYGGESKEITLNAVYGDGIVIDLSDYMAYKNGDSAADKFIYTITDGNGMGAEIDGDILTVPGDTMYGSYALTISAVEKAPNLSLMSVEDYGTRSVTLNVRITIAPRASSVTAGAAKTAVYGGTLYLEAQVSRADSGISLASARDTVDFYAGNMLLGTADIEYSNGLKDSGYAVLETKADKRLIIGENKITAEYGGSINLAGSGSDTVTVAMTPKPLEYTVFAASKKFDGTPDASVTLTPSNTDNDDVMLTANGVFASDETGDYNYVNLSEITIGGKDAVYYTVDASNENAPLSATAHIVPASGVTSVTMPDYLCGGADAAEPIAVSDTNGVENVTYTYKAKDADDSAYVPYKPDTAGEYTVKAEFAATANYEESIAYDDFTVSHSFGGWSMTKIPTMTETGSAERSCIGGDMTEETEVTELSDAGVWTEQNRVEPTYSGEGSVEYVSEYGTVTQQIPRLTVSGIRIKTLPAKTEMIEGMPLDISGLTVENVYPDGTAAETNDYEISGYDASKLGEQTIEVTRGEFKAEFSITVIAKSLIGIEITSPPDRLLYNMGESLDTSGMRVTAKYNNYTSELVTGYEVSGYDMNSAGEQTVTVSYNGQTARFKVTVIEPEAPMGTVEKPLIQITPCYGGKTVYITCAESGAEIYYTTDGTEPSSSSTRYGEPIKLTESAQIKAIAIKQDMNDSEVSAAEVTVIGVGVLEMSVKPGEVEAGTPLKLTTSTADAEIYYTTEESLTADNYKKYSGGIVISKDMTIRAIAVKKGCADSAVLEAAYTVRKATPAPTEPPVPTLTPTEPPISTSAPTEPPVSTSAPTEPPTPTEPPVPTSAPTEPPTPTQPPTQETTPERVLLYPGFVTGRVGDTVDLPIYIYSGNTVTSYRVTVDYDSGAFEYESVTLPEGVAASDMSVSVSDGKVTIRYSGGNIMSDELCQISLRAKDQASEGEHGITISDASVKTEISDSTEIMVWDGYIDLSSVGTKVIADALLTDSEQNVLHDPSEISGDITAYIFIEDLYDVPVNGINASVILAFYDEEGALVTASLTDATL